MSTFVVGAIALAFMAIGAAARGLGGALIFLAIFAALTGLYVVITGRRSWAPLPGSRKAGAVVLAASLVLFVVGGLTVPTRTTTGIQFQRGPNTSSAVQIDHAVALGDAWLKGAQKLTEAQRMAFANDPLNLQATDGPTDVQKGDSDAAAWLPPNKSFQCNYDARQISVKSTHNLW